MSRQPSAVPPAPPAEAMACAQGPGRRLTWLRRVVPWAALLLVAAVVRLSSWNVVFNDARVSFVSDTDPHYHALRALRTIDQFPHVPRIDPAMNYPLGATILWPQLFDLLIALPARLLGGEAWAVERAAALLPVVIGVATLPLVGAIGSTLVGPRAGFVAAAVLAFLPAHTQFSVLGRADQHVLELFMLCWILLAFLRCWLGRQGETRAHPCRTLLLGLGIAASFWNWQGSVLYLALLGLFGALWHVLDRTPDGPRWLRRELALGSLAGAALLGFSLAAFAPDVLSTIDLRGTTSFHLLMVALFGAFTGMLWSLSRFLSPDRGRLLRIVEILAATAVPAAVARKERARS